MTRDPVVSECTEVECHKIVETKEGQFCATYISPTYWWGIVGRCPIPTISKEEEAKFNLNPLKRAKRGGKDRPMVPTRIYSRSGEGRRFRYVENL